MSNFFNNKRVWITGASAGIGAAIAKEMAVHGAQLVLSARSETELQQVATKCRELGAGIVIVQVMDLSRHDQIPQLVQNVLSKVGKVDILINNGGISQRALAKDTSLEVDKKLMDVNFFGTITLTKALLPSMLTHQLGHIVTITSLTGMIGSPFRTSYAASKHALHGFFDSLRAEVHDSSIKVTLVCPGFIRTNVSINALTGSGEKLGTMDDATNKGMAPERLARKILRAIENGRQEVYFGGKEVLAIYVKRFFPALFAKILTRAKVR
ncbi:MAG: SDR family oxidoreductase [Saprospiraceae bacterium]|nr:SDR family oxidoreductase [Lewinellaceae bacterium]